MKKLMLLLAPLFSSCATHPVSTAPIALQIPLSDALRTHCEITPFPTEAEFAAVKPADAKAWAMGREVAHNGALGACNIRAESLVALIDEANAKFNSLAAK